MEKVTPKAASLQRRTCLTHKKQIEFFHYIFYNITVHSGGEK